MDALTSKERPVFVPAVRTPKLPYLCAGAECVTCKRPVYGDWGLVPDECDTCDAERRARYYRECAQWAESELDRLTADNKALREALLKCIEAMDWEIGGEPLPTLMIAARDAARAALEGVKP